MKFKKIIPSSLLGRSLIIVFIPIITLVTLTTIIFYQTSWNIISKRLTQSVVADINVIVKLISAAQIAVLGHVMMIQIVTMVHAKLQMVLVLAKLVGKGKNAPLALTQNLLILVHHLHSKQLLKFYDHNNQIHHQKHT